ncbi:MAG: hypothetical protein H0T39_14145 [Actinobacteria bacterium]|nr:hypothetical protein [Actinomycetota bacterium]
MQRSAPRETDAAPQLDGHWAVERRGGLLPPLIGVRKRIAGDRGVTVVGPLPGVPFRVHGLELRYEAPLSGFVDRLVPEVGGFSGRAFFHGFEYGTFALTKLERGERGVRS